MLGSLAAVLQVVKNLILSLYLLYCLDMLDCVGQVFEALTPLTCILFNLRQLFFFIPLFCVDFLDLVLKGLVCVHRTEVLFFLPDHVGSIVVDLLPDFLGLL